MAESLQTGERAEYGSKEYEFVEKLDHKFTCIVCYDVLHHPMLTGCCGQHYCQTCLDKCNSSSWQRKCPHCHVPDYSSMLNKSLERDIRSLKIFCTNRPLGCKWADELNKLSHHLESEQGCDFVRTKCVLCGENLNRGQLTKHLAQECLKRAYECEHCGKRDTYIAITGENRVISQKGKVPNEKGHYAKCPEYITNCPNMCGKKMKRKEIKGHRTKCPCEEVTCTFRGANEKGETMSCGRKMGRSELPNHKSNCLLRRFECRFCKKASTYVAITGERSARPPTEPPQIPPDKGHYAKCPGYPLACKNKCQSGDVKRADMEQHLTVCPLEPVPCPVRDMGCQEMVYRKDLNEHLTRNQQQHFSLMCSAYTQTKTELVAAKTEIETLRTSIDSTTKKLATVMTELTETLPTLSLLCQTSMDELYTVKAQLESLKAQRQEAYATAVGVKKAEELKPPKKERFWKKK